MGIRELALELKPIKEGRLELPTIAELLAYKIRSETDSKNPRKPGGEKPKGLLGYKIERLARTQVAKLCGLKSSKSGRGNPSYRKNARNSQNLIFVRAFKKRRRGQVANRVKTKQDFKLLEKKL